MLKIGIEHNDAVIQLNVSGELFEESLNQMASLWNEQISRHPKTIAINCSELTGIDSPAIASLVQLLNNAIHNNIDLVLYNLSPVIQRLFERTGLDAYFTITTEQEFYRRFVA